MSAAQQGTGGGSPLSCVPAGACLGTTANLPAGVQAPAGLSRHQKRWRADEVAQVKAMVAQGMPRRDIGLLMGRTEAAIVQLTTARGFPNRVCVFTEDKLRMLMKMKRQAMRNREIAAALGISINTVMHKWTRIRQAMAERGVTPPDVKARRGRK